MTLRQGDKGPMVVQLQQQLISLGYDVGKAGADGDYGTWTKGAVLAFQLDYTDLDDDGVAGPLTRIKIDSAIQLMNNKSSPIVECNAETWAAFMELVNLIIDKPIKYGPGRGLWVNDHFVITHGPGSLGSKKWSNAEGKSYASFHCSSFTNFILGWLLRRNEQYTHAGNIPDLLTQLCVQDATLHQNPGAGPWRGYGDACTPVIPDGTSVRRHGVSNAMDIRELYERRFSMPTFVVCGQSTKRSTGWLWWHHTVLFVFYKGQMYRIAADGFRSASTGYSATPMRWVTITPANLATYGNCVYRGYSVDTIDGSYGDQDKPIASVQIES